MRLRARRCAVATMTAAAALALAACGPSTHAKPSATAPPVSGGTLRIVAASGPDHLDPVPAASAADHMLERAYTRQLLSYPTVPALSTASQGWRADVTPVADIATEVPSEANGGITAGGTVYTFHLRPGVRWDSSPPQQVTAADFIREFKAFCDPVNPAGDAADYESTIAGLRDYCRAEQSYFAPGAASPTAAKIAGFEDSHTISGLSAPTPLTLRVVLTGPASDFLSLMALPYASARPASYDAYLPDSPQLDQHTLSDGPYRITSYLPGRSITLARNPAWQQSTDPVRHQYVTQVVVTEGVTSAPAQLADMRAGTEDLPMDTPLDQAAIPGLLASHTPQFHVWGLSDLDPYLAFNFRSPDAGGAMKKLLVRRAIEAGVDKVTAARAAGGPAVARVLGSLVPPGSSGATAGTAYPDGNGNGNPAQCKSDLAKAGYPHGLPLVYLYPSDSADTSVARAVESGLAACGITVQGKPQPITRFFVTLGDTPLSDQPHAWDMAQVVWFPSWYGDNGRALIQPLFDSPCVLNTADYGCFHDAAVHQAVVRAEASARAAAETYWRQAALAATAQAVIVPLVSQGFPLYTSARVGPPGGDFSANIGDPDITNLWLRRG